mmetsp:Transcript_5836/g.7626  ORF Transcript_5836/g.7626 Transcript_5836/m.7626 type:complete len:312 (-) Transcript_5836:1143-2078(-)
MNLLTQRSFLKLGSLCLVANHGGGKFATIRYPDCRSLCSSRFFSTERKIFDSKVKALHFERFCRESELSEGEFDYLRTEVASHLVERLGDIRRKFPVGLDLGCRNGTVGRELLNRVGEGSFLSGGIETLKNVDVSEKIVQAAINNLEKESLLMPVDERKIAFESKVAGFEEIGDAFEPNSIDVAMSCLSLHWTNDLVSALKSINQVLRPDGVFLAAMFGNDTLFELRTALAAAEQEREGGLSPHISPMIQPADCCSLLSQAGFSLTTVDTLNIEVEFSDAFKCMQHLSLMVSQKIMKCLVTLTFPRVNQTD